MRINKKRLLEAVMISSFIVLVMFGWQVLHDYILTKKVEAELISKYASVHFLQKQTSFGPSNGFGWLVAFVAGLWIAMIAIYYFARIYIDRLKSK